MAYAPVQDPAYDANPAYSFSSESDQLSYQGRHEQVSSPEVQSSHSSYHRQEQTISPDIQSTHSSHHGNQKQYTDIDFQEPTPYWTTHGAYSIAPSHQRGWSGSTISTDALKGQPGVTTSVTSPTKKKTLSFSTSESWTLEIVTIIIAFGAVASIMGVLARFNGHALPEWPYYITLNALIALLATVTTATMTISLQNGLSQLKWIRFKEARAPLSDMEIFDEASRGTWGAMKLLASARGGFLGSFGAVVAIIALALGPFAQQIVTYQTRTVESPEGASVNKALNYTGALPGNTSKTGYVPILPLKSAVYNGLFAENGRPGAALAFQCQSGNCTWDSYDTLGVCHECVDLTPFISQYCASDAEADECGWQVPQGARLNSSREVFSMTSQVPTAQGSLPHSTIVKLIFMGTEAYDGLAGETKPWARQCTLSACRQTLKTNVSNGILNEEVIDSAVNQTVLDNTNLNDGADHNVYALGTDGFAYMLGIEAMLSMRGWFSTLFASGAAVRSASSFNRTITDNTVVVNLTVGISSGETFFDSDIVTAFYWNYYEYATGLDMLMSDMATSMTVAFRSFLGAAPASGRAISMESYVHVLWGFAVVPIVVVVGAAFFLIGAIYWTERTHTKVWKSSALAMLFHGLDSDTKAEFMYSCGLPEQKRQARGVKVQLDGSDGGGSLARGM
ncbi:hypothetical protein F5Y15DRAFT_269493 [Xylariaceae sp. FL0016]|nr:hypothetical protein F5Y15DRAFT_269493 [Xylariaceae sp. FL0016]